MLATSLVRPEIVGEHHYNACPPFDFEPATLAYMDGGYIQVTHVQRQYYVGYLA